MSGALTPQVAIKSVAALGIVGAATATVVLPGSVSAAAAPSVRAQAARDPITSELIANRTSALLGASRSTTRTELVQAPQVGSSAGVDAPKLSVSAPAVVTPVAAETVGIQGIEAVAKPPAETNLDATASAAPAADPATGSAAAGDVSATSGAGYSTSAFSGWCSGLGLTPNAAGVCSAVRSLFGISNIGGYRAGDWGDHGTGRAVDVMITDAGQGDAVAAFLQAHAAEMGIKYLIWKQRYWAPGGSWSLMEDRGSITQNHYDHVHVSVN